MTVLPLSLAIWQATDPTAAAETNTMFVSLRLRWFSILKSEDSAAKMLHEDQGVRQCFVRTAVSETNPASLHELRWGNDVRPDVCATSVTDVVVND
jgi:hypothetical protein